MLEKNFNRITSSFLYTKSVSTQLNKINSKLLARLYIHELALDLPHSPLLLNTGKFFKYICFFTLGLQLLSENKYRFLTLKSTLFALWSNLATYTIIF